jgi:hypothetical protein
MGVGVTCERGKVTGELTHADNSAKLNTARSSDFHTRTHLDRPLWIEIELKLTFLSSVHRQGMLIPLPSGVLRVVIPGEEHVDSRFASCLHLFAQTGISQLHDSKRDTIIVAYLGNTPPAIAAPHRLSCDAMRPPRGVLH